MKAGVLAVVLMVMAAAFPEAYCASHTVGGSSGWAQGVDYTTWANGETFTVGDTLVFNYGPSHSVQQVSQSDYTNCNTGNAIQSYSGGSNTVTLSTSGMTYFICPTPGHCQGGMKLAVNVAASSSSTPSTPPTASPSTPAGSSPSPPASSSPPPPPPQEKSGSMGSSSSALLLGASVFAAAVVGAMC